MPPERRRVRHQPGRKTPTRRVKVPPYVVPTSRRAPPPRGGLLVPTKWVKFIVALFLLPICIVLSQTFFTAFARAATVERLWAAEEFWFFSLGALLWLIAFFGLPRPTLIYVFGHELTHALWVKLMGGRVSEMDCRRDGGYIITNKNNFLIALAPYFFPIYSIFVLTIYGTASLFVNMQPYGRVLYVLVGVTWAFHLTFTLWMIPKSQSDLRDNGTVFSLVVIYLANLLLLAVMLVVASPRITFAGFGADVLRNIANFSHTVVVLLNRFERGA